jgi:hypothetical protein
VIGDPGLSVERGATRTAWLEEAVRSVARLRADGVPLVGFTWWPVFDLVNWDDREATGPVTDYFEPMGLALRSEHGELRREPLACAERMAAIITASRVGSDAPLDRP